MATYTVDHIDGMAPDLLEEVGHVLFVRTITTKASTEVELWFFLYVKGLAAELYAERSATPPSQSRLSSLSSTRVRFARRVPLPPGLLRLCALPRPPGVERLSETVVASTGR